MFKYIPNCITIFRIILVFLFMYFFNSGYDNHNIISGLVFVIAGISDILDGYIARKYSLQSDFGRLMDPLADKLMQITVAICIATVEKSLMWVPIVLMLKELVMILGAARLLKKENIVVSANKFGKISSTLYFLVFMTILFFPDINPQIKQIMCASFVVTSVIAFLVYMQNYIEIYREKRR